MDSREGKRKYLVALLVVGFLLLVFLLSISLGPASIPVKDVAKYLFTGGGTGEQNRTIFWQIRLPRVLLAIMVGAALSVAGAILQALFLNPLADPYVTGVSSGAALGATVAFVLRVPTVPWLTIAALIGGVGTLFFIYSFAQRRGVLNIYVLLLAGVTLSSFFFATISVIMIKAGEDLHALLFWLLGSFSGRGWSEVAVAMFIIPFLAVPFFYARELNILLQGEERALELGVEVERVKKIMFFVASVLTAIAVSVAGIIGFIGLVVPHMARLLLGPDHRRVLFLSVFIGASLMCLSDLIARTAFAPGEIPVGIVTIFFGAPFFVYLLKRRIA